MSSGGEAAEMGRVSRPRNAPRQVPIEKNATAEHIVILPAPDSWNLTVTKVSWAKKAWLADYMGTATGMQKCNSAERRECENAKCDAKAARLTGVSIVPFGNPRVALATFSSSRKVNTADVSQGRRHPSSSTKRDPELSGLTRGSPCSSPDAATQWRKG